MGGRFPVCIQSVRVKGFEIICVCSVGNLTGWSAAFNWMYVSNVVYMSPMLYVCLQCDGLFILVYQSLVFV